MGLRGSVGRGGINYPADVTYVQQLLNRVAANRGGPTQPFMLLGTPGDNLNGAILRFQQANCFGVADGRIDADGPTIRQLTAMANVQAGPVNGPTSDQPPQFVPGVLDMDVKARFTIAGIVSALRSAFPHATPWTFALYVANSDTNVTRTLSFAAAGLGISVAPASGSYSTPSMYSRGIGSIWSSFPGELKAEDMAGSLMIMSASAAPLSPSAGAANGVGLSIYFLSLPNPVMAVKKVLEGPSSLYAWFRAGGAAQNKGVGIMFGVMKSTPDAGVSAIGGWAHLKTTWIL
jgi:peptidoglycan hydrolase-like protein with peptidoglycan-binding domain